MTKRENPLMKARRVAQELKNEVNSLVSVSSDFEGIPYFHVKLERQEGIQLMKECECFPAYVEGKETCPDWTEVKINGVFFWWENVKGRAA